jgi:alpha-glucosidase
MLALPGSAYVYQGEELGLPEAIDIPDDARQDPTWFRTPPEVYGRDGCRVPLPWESDAPAYGFSATGASWLPQPDAWARYAVDAQDGVAGSTLEMYRTALRTRRDRSMGAGTLAWAEARPGALDFTVAGVRVVANVSAEPLPLPRGEVLLSSGPVDGALPPDTTVWLTA